MTLLLCTLLVTSGMVFTAFLTPNGTALGRGLPAAGVARQNPASPAVIALVHSGPATPAPASSASQVAAGFALGLAALLGLNGAGPTGRLAVAMAAHRKPTKKGRKIIILECVEQRH